MSLWNRLKFMCVMWAIFILITGVAEAFIHLEKLRDLMFHSVAFNFALMSFLLIIAPYFVRFSGLKIDPERQGPTITSILLFGLGSLVLMLAILFVPSFR
jgi:hypothetical protein